MKEFNADVGGKAGSVISAAQAAMAGALMLNSIQFTNKEAQCNLNLPRPQE